MKKRQLTALLLSAVLSFSVLMPAGGISALAAEDTGPQASPEEEIQIPLMEEEASPEESTGIDDTGGLQEDVTAAPAESYDEAFTEEPESPDFEEDSAPETAEEALPAEDETLPAEEEAQTQETVIPEPAGSEDSSWQTETEQNPVDDLDDLEIPSAETASESGTDSSTEVLVPADGQQEKPDHEIIAEPSEEKETVAPTEAAVSSEDDFDSAEEIRIGDSFDVTVTEESPYAFFRFTPEADIRACIYSESESESDTYVDLFDSSGDSIDSDDDNGGGFNFKLAYSFQAGETYYFRVRMCSFQGGTFSVLLKEYAFWVDHSQEGTIYVEPHETIELHTAATSDTALTYTWSVNGEETQTGSSDSYSYTADNYAEITCQVTDENGNYDIVFYYIYINMHWSICDVGGTVFKVEKGQSQTLQVEADPEEGYEDAYVFTYAWLDEKGNVLSSSNSTFTVPEVNGSQAVVCQVNDQYDNYQWVSFRLYNPGWLNVYPSESQEGSTSYIRFCEPGDAVTLSVSSAEEEGGITYSWYDENDSLLASGEEQEYLLEDVRTYRTIRCHAEDQNGNYADLLFYVKLYGNLTVYPEGSENESNWISIDITGEDSVVLRTFAENSAGLAVTFQWEKQSMVNDPENPDEKMWPSEWEEIPGAHDAVYTVTDPQVTDRYICTVWDEAGNAGTAGFEFYTETPDFSAEELANAVEISFGDSVPVEVTAEKPVAWFRFTPEADGTYELYSESGEEYLDTFATLCSSKGVSMATADSGAENEHFSLRAFLEGGKTYYFGVKEFFDEAATFTIHLVSGEVSDWLSNYEYSIEKDQIRLTTYFGNGGDITVPGSATARGQEFHRILLSRDIWEYSDITSLTLEKGVIIPEYAGSLVNNVERLVSADLSKADFSNTVDLSEMFYECPSLVTVDLGGADLSNIESGSSLFYHCNCLKTIYVPTGLTEVIHLPAIYQGSNGALYGTLPRRLNKSMCILYARDLKPGESGDPVYAAGVTLSTSKYTYNGTARKPSVTVKSGDTVLTEGTDYTVAYKNNVKAGKATVTVTGKGFFTSSVSKTFTINKAAQKFTLKAPAKTHPVGKAMKLTVSGAKGSPKITFKSSNTAIAAVNSKTGAVTVKKVGKVTFTATSAATANYKAGKATVTVNIVPAATASITATNRAKGIKLTWKKVAGATGYRVYRGSTLIKKITSGSTVTYTDTKANTNGAKYTFKIVPTASTGTGVSKSCVIYRVARPAISSLTNSASKRMTVKWGKNAKATSYQIQYGLKSSFSGAKTVSAAKAATVSKVITGLTKGKTYYVRIRTCKKVGNSTYYSLWSATKKVKISK